jgi:low temperature requirement protein LtrA
MPLELFFDLVLVLALTQCTALMIDDPSWAGMGRGILVLALLWWAWSAYAWLTSVVDPEEGGVRLVLAGAMAALLIAALAVPEAFGDRAIEFVIAYAALRAAHIGLFAIAGRDDRGLARSVLVITISTSISIGLLLVGAALGGDSQVILWIAAAAFDLGLPFLFGQEGWKLVPEHFAERFGLIVIVALGESIVALGVGADVGLTLPVTVAAVLGVALVFELWWAYFDIVAIANVRRLVRAEPGLVQNELARDVYSYLHLALVVGIELAAFGLHEVLAHPDHHLDDVHAFALLGGVAIYLLGHVAIRLRGARTWNLQRLGLAALLFALVPVAMQITPLASVAIGTGLLATMIVFETRNYGDTRSIVRHDYAVGGALAEPSPRDD